MKKLGQILVDQGWLSPAKVSQALQHQQIFGGRLGTCLLELNLLSEDKLAQAIGQQAGVDVAKVEDLRNIPDLVLRMVPSRMALKAKVVPFDRYSTEARVAMINTRDLLLQDELSFVTSKRIKVFVAPEIRILEALEKHYGCDIDQRYQRIWDRLNRARYLWQEASTAPGTPDAVKGTGSDQDLPLLEVPTTADVGQAKSDWKPSPVPHLEQPSIVPSLPSRAPVVKRPAAKPKEAAASPVAGAASVELAEVSLPSQPGPEAKPDPAGSESVSTRPMPSMTPPETLEALEEVMMEVVDRDHIAHALVLYLSERFSRVLCFMVRGDEVAGWMGTGREVDEAKIEAFRLDFEEPSLFLNIKAGVPIYRGPVLRMATHEGLVDIWGGKYPKECILLPVHIKGRLVAVIYLDKGGRALGGVNLGEIQEVGRMTGRAFESFLVRRKQQSV